MQTVERIYPNSTDSRRDSDDGSKAPVLLTGETRTGQCSWCFAHTTHSKTEQKAKAFLSLARPVFQCEACNRPTAGCRFPACGAFARGLGTLGDEKEKFEELCYVHRGILKNWNDWGVCTLLPPRLAPCLAPWGVHALLPPCADVLELRPHARPLC
ncbi:hypothetical protein CYMTET_22459 [Cymbomonas tetramitiformis]|uniref:Uncharacterized protein n=1 Tax=Cymbomonas tetramitiformis TaxID=36881 RepID=A0AAE0L294_9CHLO|nr:hypothetical protein CYMTET_22459 [Cymbomonas tetramitiformis]